MSGFTALPSVAFSFVPLNMIGESICNLQAFLNVCLLGTFFSLLLKIGMQDV
jgi:hypothetical protein